MNKVALLAAWLLFLSSCDFFQNKEDPGETLPVPPLSADDSAAIADLKQSLGVWNGNVRDWATTIIGSRVTELEIQNPSGRDIQFQSSGLEKLNNLFIKYGGGGGARVLGMERFEQLSGFGFSGGKGLARWPIGIWGCRSIKVLNVSNNGFTEVSDSIVNLSGLRIVYFESNYLSGVPLFVMQMQGLVKFDLIGNRICSPTSEEIKWLDVYSPSWNPQNCS